MSSSLLPELSKPISLYTLRRSSLKQASRSPAPVFILPALSEEPSDPILQNARPPVYRKPIYLEESLSPPPHYESEEENVSPSEDEPQPPPSRPTTVQLVRLLLPLPG
jgi:hypothetical protein